MTELSSNFMLTTINDIKDSHEFMLSYASQGSEFYKTDGSGASIKQAIDNLEDGLEKIVYAIAEKIESLDLPSGAFNALEDFKDRLAEDAGAAQKALRVVQSAPSISSQLVAKLNDSVHIQGLLTDISLIDEAMRAHTA